MIIPQIGSNRDRETSFGYKSVLKTIYKENRLPSVQIDIYGGRLSKNNVTLEHLVPHSQGGPSALSNYALATKENNNGRDVGDLMNYTTLDTIKKYLNQFRNIIIKNEDGTDRFNGNGYINMVNGTLKRMHINLVA